jgi:hypothetical protein
MLNLSEKTVEFHKHHIMEAINLKNNAELIFFAVKQGLLSIDPKFAETQPALADKFLNNMPYLWLGIPPVALPLGGVSVRPL